MTQHRTTQHRTTPHKTTQHDGASRRSDNPRRSDRGAAAEPAIEAALKTLTLEQKAALLSGDGPFTLHAEPSIGLESLAFSDGPTGVRGIDFLNPQPVALLPNATVIAASFDDRVANRVGEILAAEARRQDVDVVLGPTINLHRTPLGGRLFEAYSEDPYLTGRTAAAYVRGLQGRGVGATLKHLVANESENLRNFMDSQMGEDALREVYLLPFEIAVEDANPWTMMAAYNGINGVAATEHGDIQNGIVKGEWGWDGLIMSDWFATKSTAGSANGGLDLVMPGPGGPWRERLVRAVRDGHVSEATVDEHVRRLLRLAARVGKFAADGDSARELAELPGGGGEALVAPDAPERQRELREIAARGMVLLKNNDDVLPLAQPRPGQGAARPVVLIGRAGIDTVEMGGGSAYVNPPYQISIAQGLREVYGGDEAGADVVRVVDGPRVRQRPRVADAGALLDPVTGTPGIHVTYLDERGEPLLSRHSDGAKINAEPEDVLTKARETGTRLGAIALEALYLGSAGNAKDAGDAENAKDTDHRTERTRIGAIGAGHWVFTEPVHLAKTLDFSGFDPGEAVLKPPSFEEVRAIEVPAPVRASVTLSPANWREKLAAVPNLNLPDEAHLLEAAGLGAVALAVEPDLVEDQDLLGRAVAAAQEAKDVGGVAVVVVGLSEEQETEAADKSTLALPGRQDELVERVAQTGVPTVVVVNAATPILMPWADRVDAILVVGLPGQEGGRAVADVLTGRAEPTGRLVTSYPSADGAAPAWGTDVDDSLRLNYDDGTAIGYRGYAAGNAPAPRYWFGEGLGYGKFEYSDAKLSQGAETGAVGAADPRTPAGALDAGSADETAPAVSVRVRNVAPVSSREVVQLYLRPQDGSPTRLVGYTGVDIPADGFADVTVTADPRLLRSWNGGRWQPFEGGEFLLARGLGDVRATVPWRAA